MDNYEFAVVLFLFLGPNSTGWDKDNILISNYTIWLWFDKFYTFFMIYGNGTILQGVSKPITNGTTQCQLATHSIRNSSRFATNLCLQVPTPAGQVAGFLLQKPTNDILESGDLHHRPNWPTFIKAWNRLDLFMSVVDCGSLHLPPNMSKSSSG